ncbi:MAG: hypothetical protein HZA19_07025 [Nitrospirae bacterium]|nr:hypothetical protein [Nitrospirota bacterium]
MDNVALAWTVASVAAFLLNFPFGVLRAGTKTFSFKWFVYIHLPVFVVIPIRMGVGLSYWAIPVLVACSVLGQVAGGRIGRRFKTQ